MNEYKYTNEEKTGVKKVLTGESCLEGDSRMWLKFQEYLAAGGQVDPWKTAEEISESILAEKLIELKTERDLRVDVLIGTSDPRKMINMLMKAVRTINRKVDGDTTIPQADLTTLAVSDSLVEAIDLIDTAHDTAESWLEDPLRTDSERTAYDVVNDPSWPVV